MSLFAKAWKQRRARSSSAVVAFMTVVGVATAGFGLFTAPAGTAVEATTAPYTDPNAVGYIGLCNQAGQQITTGSVTSTPFAWRAVSSQAAPAPYNGAGGTAILGAYLPMQSLAPGDWSGEQLTASTRYSNPQSPMAQATAKDVPLQVFLQDYPPHWDGFVQLRLFLGVPDQPAYVQHYPALNLQISGDTWTAVGGGPVNCIAGTAESLESVLTPTPTTVATSGLAASGTTTSTTDASAPSGKFPAASAAAASGRSRAPHASGVAVAQPQSRTHSGPWYLLLLVAAVLLIALSALLIARHRRAQRLSSTASRTSVKGPQQ